MGKAGTTDLDPMALKKRWYRLGASFDFGVSANRAHFHLTGLDEQFDAALSLMRSVIARPSLSDDAFASSKSLILKRRRDAQKDPGSLAYALREYQYYGADSRSLKRLSATELQALKLADLLAMPKGLLDYEHHVSYTGPRKPETVAARFANSASSLRKPPAPRLREMRTPQESEIYFLHKDTAQAQIRIGFPVGNFDDAESADAEVFNSYFDGDMSAIVFQELREARGLAYIAGGGYSQGSRVGAQNRGYGYIGCQPDKAPEALGGLIGLIDALPISPKYFSTVKTGLISDYRGLSTSYRDILSSLRYWEHQGLSPDPRRTHFARIQEMTLDDLIAFHKSHMSGRPKLITIVGDRARLDLQALATYGQIRELQPSDIFSN
jgi:predicted Zn-dependent peptidase